MIKQYLQVGKIASTHGIHGEIRIDPWCDSADFLTKFKYFYIGEQAFEVTRARVHKRQCIAALLGVNDINAAMKLKNTIISIDREDVSLPPGSHFIQDIIGFSVFDENGQPLGILLDVLTLPAHDVYVVNGASERMIPAVSEFILSVDIERGEIRVRLIEGM